MRACACMYLSIRMLQLLGPRKRWMYQCCRPLALRNAECISAQNISAQNLELVFEFIMFTHPDMLLALCVLAWT